jgi:hypothetical protein
MKKILNIILFFGAISSVAIAQNTEGSHVPHLNNHYFIPVSNAPWAFTNSHLSTNLGVATSEEFEKIYYVLNGEQLVALTGAMIFADLSFDYQQRIKDWVAFYANVGLTARVGTDVLGILSQGVNTVTSLKLGWVVRIAQHKKYQLAGSIQLNNHSATFINISDFVESIVEDSIITSITKEVPILNASLGLRYAYAINELYGIQAFAEFGYGDSYERGVDGPNYRVGGSFDVNLATRTKVPLGIAAFFISGSIPDIVQVKSKASNNTGLRISYSGAPHFNFGIELSRLMVPVPNMEEKIKSTAIVISTRYYFN